MNAFKYQAGRWLLTDSVLLQEYERRFGIWLDNMLFIDSYNSEEKTHWVSQLNCLSVTLGLLDCHAPSV